jgi:hypothetical protein
LLAINVVEKRLKTLRCVVVAGGVEIEGIKTHRRIVAAGAVAIGRLPTKGRVVNAGCELEERVGSLSRVPVRIAAVRRRANRLRSGQKRKAGKRHGWDNKRADVFRLNEFFIECFFLFPAALTLGLQGPEEAKDLTGENVLRLIQIPFFNDAEF